MDLIPVQPEEVLLYLKEKREPVMEIELIRHFTGDAPRRGEEALFRVHFSLYHALYRLKKIAGEEGFYLHLDPMRLALVELPDVGCSHYLPESGAFCGEILFRGRYCSIHAPLHHDESFPVYDPLSPFYLNPDNISFGNSHILKRISRGILIYGFKKGEIEEALAFFEIVSPDRKTIRKRYYQLARKYHPDSSEGNASKMKRVNHAYNILKEVFVL